MQTSSRREPTVSRQAPAMRAGLGPDLLMSRAAMGVVSTPTPATSSSRSPARLLSFQPERQAEEDGVEDDVDACKLGVDADQRAVRCEHTDVEKRLGHATLAAHQQGSGDGCDQ